MNENVENTILQNVLKEMSSVREEVVSLRKQLNDLQSLKNDIPTVEELANDTAEVKVEMSPLFSRRRCGKGAIPLLESEILEAQKNSFSANEVARKLKVNIATYKKYATRYGIYKNIISQKGEGISRRPRDPTRGRYPLVDILQGKYPDYPVYRLKMKLIDTRTKQPCCEQCGFSERRLTDGKIPVLLIFEDGNSKNHKLENLKIFCYNCAFTSGKIWMKCKKREKWFMDAERILGSHVGINKYY